MSRSGPRRPGRPPQRGSRAPGDPARLAAFEVLKSVRAEDAYANLVLPHVLGRLGLEGRDAAFATELASGTLRLQGLYDAVLAACVDRPLAKVEAKVLDLLRLGTHQLLSMRVPNHAAIATTVDLVRSKVGPGAAGFANAVLRKVAARSSEEWIAEVAPSRDADPRGWAAVAFSHPRWEVEILAAALSEGREVTFSGRDVTFSDSEVSSSPEEVTTQREKVTTRPSEVEQLLAADNDRPRVVLVARPGRASVDELIGPDNHNVRTAYSPYGVVLESGSPTAVPAVAEGRAAVQDEGSQLVALALAEAPLEGRDELWLDLCAGPGGKSGLLAAIAAQRGAVVVGNERQPHRAGLVRRNLTDSDALVPGALGVVAGDGTRPPYRPGSFDRILVDAPCTGLGALRRRPEARWRRRPEDLAVLVPLQRTLLRSALDLVRPGGAVVYSTCSPALAETRDVVSEILAEDPAIALEAVAGTIAGVPDAAGPLPGTVQLWPHRHGTDAMFVALLRRAT